MTEEDMKMVMTEVKKKMRFVNDMEVVPVEIIDSLVMEMETQIDMMVKGA
jgi:hypothetical protein